MMLRVCLLMVLCAGVTLWRAQNCIVCQGWNSDWRYTKQESLTVLSFWPLYIFFYQVSIYYADNSKLQRFKLIIYASAPYLLYCLSGLYTFVQSGINFTMQITTSSKTFTLIIYVFMFSIRQSEMHIL